MKIVELDPKTWLRGERSNVSYLLRPWDDKMCCLGQACLTFGLSESDIYERMVLHELHTQCPDELAEAFMERDGDRNSLYSINDNETRFSRDEDRVEALNNRLELIGAKFRFSLSRLAKIV
jgi:hypothetical protein